MEAKMSNKKTKTSHAKARALLIGINHYPRYPQHELHGCINDVDAMSQVLKKKRPDFEITKLTSTNASNTTETKPTRDNILNAIEQLISATGKDDIVVIYYSGHGSRQPNPEKHTEWNETIVPCDCHHISDVELNKKLLLLTEKTTNVTLIFDSCHSGSIARDPFGAKARFMPPDVTDETPSQATKTAESNTFNGSTTSGWLRPIVDSHPMNRGYVLLAGCTETESSYEDKVPGTTLTHGAWTYFLCGALQSATSGTTYRDIFEKCSPLVTSVFKRQHPQLEGSPDRELFGTKEIGSTPFVSIESHDQDTGIITLAAGAAMGITPNSQWIVYPPATKHPNKDEHGKLADIEITQVLATTSLAKLVGNTSSVPKLETYARAFEKYHHFGELKLKVFVQVPSEVPPNIREQANQLDALLRSENTGMLRRVNTETEAEIKVYLLLPTEKVLEGNPVPQLRLQQLKLNEPLWVTIGRDGKLCVPTHSVDEKGTQEVFNNLEKLARFEYGLQIENKDSTGSLLGKIEFHLVCKKDGQWKRLEAPDQLGYSKVKEGEKLGCEISNHYSETVYVRVLEFGESGAIKAIFPAKKASEPLAPGKTVRFGEEYGFVRIAKAFKDMLEAMPNSDAFGVPQATLKVFVTLNPADFSFLEQDNFRGMGRSIGTDNPIALLLRAALCGRREFVNDAENLPLEWYTVQKTFELVSNETPIAGNPKTN